MAPTHVADWEEKLTYNNRKHLHGLPLTAVDLGSLPPLLRAVVEFDLSKADGSHWSVSVVRGVEVLVHGYEVGLFVWSLRQFPLYDRGQRWRQRGQRRQRGGDGGGLLQLTTRLNTVPQLGSSGLFPAPEPTEHSTVQQQHDGTGDEEGADGGVDDVVVVLQFALPAVTTGHVVDAECDGRGHGHGQDPGGRQKDGLTQVHVLPVVVQRDGHGDKSAGQTTKR